MKKIKLNLFVCLAILSLVASSCYKDDLYSDENASPDTEWSEDEEAGAGDGSTVTLTSYKINGDEITKIKDYDVRRKMLPFQEDVSMHYAMFDYYTNLIPAENRGYITEYVVFHGKGQIAGYVEPINYNNLNNWRMALAIDHEEGIEVVDLNNDFAYTVIHEYGHTLTLNGDQLAAGGDESSCANFHTGEGCSNSNSYINTIYEIGWKDIYQEFQNGNEDPYAMYDKYPDRFVTEYAATNPGEDVAEVFTVFVTQDNMPAGNTIADQKVRALYNYPELVSLRDEIRQDPVVSAMAPGSWVNAGKRHQCKH